MYPEDNKIEETPVVLKTKSGKDAITKEFADNLTQLACKRVKACVDFKQPRMDQIRDIEDMIAYKQQPALKGRLNIPFDGIVMNGFIETLVSGVKDFPKVQFKDPKGSNLIGVKKTQAFFEQDTSDTKGKWKKKDRLSKRLCAISNIGIFELHTSSEPAYKHTLNIIDHYDYLFDPNGETDTEEHNMQGRMNLFKIKEDLKSKIYDQVQVASLISAYTAKDFKKNEDIYNNKINRLSSLGLDIQTNSFDGQDIYNFTELELEYGGERYYLLFDYCSKTWIRCEYLSEIFESNLYSYCAWNAIENPFTLMGPGPADMIKVIAEAIRVNLNEVLNNNRKRNWDMKAVDGEMFDISDLDWRQDGIVSAKVPLNGNIQNGIYRFETPEISGALNLNTYLNGLVGINSGISDQTKGQSSQDTLGIARLDEVNVSKRMSLISDSYNECLANLVLRWDWGQWEHLDDEYAIKVLGKDGPELVSFTKEDSEPDYEIAIITNTGDQARNKIENDIKKEALKLVVTNPTLMSQYNPGWLADNILAMSGFSEEEIKIGRSKEDYAAEQVSKANKAIEMIISNQKADDVPDATALFLQVLHDYMVKNKAKLSPEHTKALEDYFDKQSDYAAMNATRVAMNPPVQPIQPQNIEKPMPPQQIIQ